MAAFPRLARRLQAIVELRQKVANAALADLVPPLGQFLRQSRRAFARPAQRRHRIAACRRLDERVEIPQERRILVRKPFPSAAFGANPLADSRRRGACQSRGRTRQLELL